LQLHEKWIDSLATRMVIPLRPAALYKNRLHELNKSVANRQDTTDEILAALDCIFGSY